MSVHVRRENKEKVIYIERDKKKKTSMEYKSTNILPRCYFLFMVPNSKDNANL